jgi:hypothetical protein
MGLIRQSIWFGEMIKTGCMERVFLSLSGLTPQYFKPYKQKLQSITMSDYYGQMPELQERSREAD